MRRLGLDKLRSLQGIRGDLKGCWLRGSGLQTIRYCTPGSNGQGPGLNPDSRGACPSRGLTAEAGSTARGSASALGVLVPPSHPLTLGTFPLGTCSTFTSPRCAASGPARGRTLVYTCCQEQDADSERGAMSGRWGKGVDEQRKKGRHVDKGPETRQGKDRDLGRKGTETQR